MTRAFVGLGSNVGDRLAHLRSAVDRLALEAEVVSRSSVYETEAVGPKQADFLNAVVEIETELKPQDLLATLKGIEQQMGRSPGERWGPREIDLDLLLHGAESVETAELVVPHPQLWERDFVLVPLREIAPDVVTVAPGGQGVRRVGSL